MVIRELFVKLRMDSSDTEDRIKRVSKEADNAKKEFDKLGTAMSAVAAIGLGAMVTSFAKSSLETFGKFEKYETVLKTTFTNTADALKAGMDVATYSAHKATEAMELIKQFAADTPYSVDELTGSFIKLANRGMVPSMDTMMAFGDVAASQGKSFDQFTEAVLDAVSGEFERMKEFGIKASKSGNQVSLAFKGINKTIANTPEAIQQAIIEFGKMEGVAGGMDAVSKTLTGRLSALGDSFDNIKNKVGSMLAKIAGPILDFFTDKEHGSTRLNLAVGILAVALGTTLVLAAKSAMLAGYAMLVPYLPMIALVAAISAGVMGLYLVLEDIYTFMEYGPEGSETFFGDFLKMIGFTNEDMQKLRDVFNEFKLVLSQAGQKMGEFFESEAGQKIIAIAKTIAKVTIAISLLPAIVGAAIITLPLLIIAKWDDMMNWMRNQWNRFATWFRKTAIMLGKILIISIFPLSALYFFKDEIKAVFQSISNYITNLPFVQNLINQFYTLKDRISAVFSGMWQSLTATFKSLLPTDTLNTIIDGMNWISAKLNEFSSGSVAKTLGITPLNLPVIPRIEARALGGPITAGMPYLVGERGPELIIPRNSGNVIPNDRLQAGSGNSPIIFNATFNLSGGNAKEQAVDIWETLKQLAKDNQNEIRVQLGLRPV